MKEEDKLWNKLGTDTPFTVPEGYFEQLTANVMSNLPEKQPDTNVVKKPTMWERVKPWTYMAAMFVGAALIIRIASNGPSTLNGSSVAGVEADSEMAYDEYIDNAVNGAMLDEYSLYMYLSDASSTELN